MLITMEQLKFFINNEQVDCLSSFTVNAGLKQPVSQFSFDVDPAYVERIFCADMFTISDENENTYYTGIISEQEEIYERRKKLINYNGKNLAGFLNRDETIVEDFNNKSLREILTFLVDTSNVSGRGLTLQFDDSANSLIKKFQSEYGDTVMDTVIRLANKKGLFVFLTPNNVLHIESPTSEGDIVKEYNFDQDGGLNADLRIKRGITDAATDIEIQGYNKVSKGACPGDFFSGVACRYTSTRANQKGSFFSGIAENFAGKTKANDGQKYAGDFDHPILEKFYKDRAYAVMGSTRTAPPDDGEFRQIRYFKLTNEDIASLEEQKERIIRSAMPKFSINIKFDHIELPQINRLYKIKDSVSKIDDTFLLSSFTIRQDATNNGITELNFTLPGFFE